MEGAAITPFTVAEVKASLSLMRHGKSAGIAVYGVDLFRGCPDSLFLVVADLFTFFARSGYPRKLNTLLLMPLYKSKGSRDSCDNYRGISLIHPLGRWFSKTFVARLESDPAATRARG